MHIQEAPEHPRANERPLNKVHTYEKDNAFDGVSQCSHLDPQPGRSAAMEQRHPPIDFTQLPGPYEARDNTRRTPEHQRLKLCFLYFYLWDETA